MMYYHFVLTYSNWESVTVCFSESFESLSEGLQNALWELGGVPVRHRSDRMSAAVNNLTPQREFTTRYQGLMNHYGLTMEKTGARKAHENGDVESLHHHFNRSVIVMRCFPPVVFGWRMICCADRGCSMARKSTFGFWSWPPRTARRSSMMRCEFSWINHR